MTVPTRDPAAWPRCNPCGRVAVPGAVCTRPVCPFQRDRCDPPHLIDPTPKERAR
jgi:hypothetical protein